MPLIENLPPELLLSILKYLDVKDLCKITSVSKTWKKLSEDNRVWDSFVMPLFKVENKSQKDNYKLQVKQLRFKDEKEKFLKDRREQAVKVTAKILSSLHRLNPQRTPQLAIISGSFFQSPLYQEHLQNKTNEDKGNAEQQSADKTSKKP